MSIIDRAEREEFARALMNLNHEHKIHPNGQGGYDCKCGARWDWQKAEKEAADFHEAMYIVDQLVALGYGKL